METKSGENFKDIKLMICTLLENSYYTGFFCNTRGFILYFEKSSQDEINGYKTPWNIEFNIYSEWWHNSANEWNDTLLKYGNNQIVEPHEPVRAYELSSLMWMEGSKINKVELDDYSIKIIFENKKTITIKNRTDMDYAWVIYGRFTKGMKDNWTFTCECDGKLYTEVPF